MERNEQSGGQSIDSYRGFPLSRPALTQILNLAVENSTSKENTLKNLTFETIREGTTLGTNFVESMRRYIRHTRLLDKLDHPTPFGRMVNECDLGLSHPTTQWAMHYHLSSAQNGSPIFWRDVLLTKILPGNSFTSAEVATYISDTERQYNRTYATRTLRNASLSFVGSYFHGDALNMLGLLDKEADKYVVKETEPPSVGVFAYVLADHWETVWQERSTINLREVIDKNGPAALLFLNSGETDYYLTEMQEAGLLEVNRRVPPYQVVRLWKSAQFLLEQLYA